MTPWHHADVATKVLTQLSGFWHMIVAWYDGINDILMVKSHTSIKQILWEGSRQSFVFFFIGGFVSVYLDIDKRKHQSSASLAFVRGIHRGPVNSPHKGPVTRKTVPFDDVIMLHSDIFRCYPGHRPAYSYHYSSPASSLSNTSSDTISLCLPSCHCMRLDLCI